jgi:hypothetical protein
MILRRAASESPTESSFPPRSPPRHPAMATHKPALKDIPDLFSAGWSSTDSTPFLKLFSDAEDVTLTDHGAQIVVPRSHLHGHHQNWRHCHADFEVKVDHQFPVFWIDVDEAKGNAKVSFRTSNRGVFVNDLPRRKASGKPFHFTAVIDLIIEGGKIVKADEWLRIPFEDSVPVSEYIRISEFNRKMVMRDE